ncbi:MAG: site-specific integrase [Sedimenticola sp.]
MNSYLLDRNGRFYFRIRVPETLQPYFGRREIKKSLGTSDKKTAYKLAHALFVEVNDTLERMKEREPQLKNIMMALTEGQITSINVDSGDPERDLKDAQRLIETINRTVSPAPPQTPNSVTNLSIIVKEYCAEKLREKAWTPKTEQEYRSIFTLLLRIVGDKQSDQISIRTAQQYKSTLLQLPPNINQGQLKDLSIEKIVALGLPPISKTTVNKHLVSVSTLFKWAEKFEYVEKNYFDGLTVSKDKKASEERPPFTEKDIQLLFSAENYQKHKYLRPYYYWLPLIGLFSGMRIEEICQLHLVDLKEIEGVWVFDINDSGKKTLKNINSKRLVPIHSKLIELGLLKYAEKLHTRGAERLFPELKRQRDGYSQAASKWFGRVRKKLGIGPVFHSFRHTIATTLKNKGCDEPQVATLLGHSINSMTYGRYGKEYSPKVLSHLVEKLDFKVPVKPYSV